jgi:nitrite reductase/ring-hydroxylating ferredoxin subunit
VGLVHMTLNSLALGLYGASWLARRNGRSGTAGPVLAFAGLTVVSASGWLGGHLAYALGVGVDTTAFQKPPTAWTDAVPEVNLTEGRPVVVTVEDTPVLLVRLDGQLHAVGDRCTHRGGPLHEGTIADGCVECPWHGSQFDLRDGAVMRGPATRPEPVFLTRVVDGLVQVRRDEERSLRVNPTS